MVFEEIEYKYVRKTSLSPFAGRNKHRPLYHFYLKAADALIFMMDSNEGDFFEHNVMRQFRKLMHEDKLQQVPVAVLANKRDVAGAITYEEIAEILDIQTYYRDRKVEIFPASTDTGEGIHEALQWIANTLRQKDVRDAVVLPLQEAIPQPVKDLYQTADSALNTVFKTDLNEKKAIAATA